MGERKPENKCLDGHAFCIRCKKPSKIEGIENYQSSFSYKKNGVAATRHRARGKCGGCQKGISRMIKQAVQSQ